MAGAVLAAVCLTRWKPAPVMAASNVNIAVDLSTSYQKLEGFGQAEPSSLAYAGGVGSTLTDSLRAIAIDKAYRQVGINMGTVGTILESPGSYAQRQNDNSDPFTINWAGFNADALTLARQYLINLAKPFGFTNYYLGAEGPNVRWGSPWLAPIRQQDYSRFLDEAAEQVLANVTYWKNTYGEEPRYFQLGNEQETGNDASISPDGSGFGPVTVTQQIVDLVKRAGARLRAAGFQNTRFMVGTEESEQASYAVAAAVLADPDASQYVGAIGYHTYPYGQGYSSISFILSTSGAGAPDPSRIAIRNQIRDLARQHNVGAWLTENSHGGVDPRSFDDCRGRAIHIHDEFVYANASAYFGEAAMWDSASQQMHFGNTNLYSGDNEGNVVLINNSTGAVDITGIGYAIGHYARWIKPGAVRVDAQSSDPLLQVTAFRDDAAGRVSLVLINNSSNSTTATVSLNAGALSGNLTGEQSTPAAYWAAVPAFAPDTPTSFHIELPPTSVTSVAGSLTGTQPGQAMNIVSSASYAAAPVAPDSIAAAFVTGLPIAEGVAQSAPLPSNLNGVTLTIQDSAGTITQAPLFFVSPNQINFQIPAGTAPGPAVFTVNANSGPLASGTATVASLAPGLYSANGNGTGVAAAQVLRVHPDRTESLLPVFQCGSSAGSCQAVPLDLRPAGDQVYLVFYGTGIRNAAPGTVTVRIGGVDATVLYAGRQSQVAGLDQVNVQLPAVPTSGEVPVQLAAGGTAANTVTIGVQ